MRTKTYKCPKCGSKKAVEIIYGMPTGDAFRLSEEGKLVIGAVVRNLMTQTEAAPIVSMSGFRGKAARLIHETPPHIRHR